MIGGCAYAFQSLERTRIATACSLVLASVVQLIGIDCTLHAIDDFDMSVLSYALQDMQDHSLRRSLSVAA